MKLYIPLSISILLAANLSDATPPANNTVAEEPETTTQAKSVEESKSPRAPAVTFTPSEKVGADSAVSFPVDI